MHLKSQKKILLKKKMFKNAKITSWITNTS